MNDQLRMNKFITIFFFFSLLSFNKSYGQCTANAGPDIIVCTGGTGNLGVSNPTNPPSATYSWAPATGLSCTNCPNPTVNSSGGGVYILTVNSTLPTCVSTDTVVVTVVNSPNAGFTFTGGGNCANLPVVFNNTSTGVNPSYLWTFTNPVSASSTTSTAVNPIQTFNAVGSTSQYIQISLTATSNGCSDTQLDSVLVNQTPNAVLVDPINNFINCGGGLFTVTAYDQSTPATNVFYQIDWGDLNPGFSGATFPAGGETHIYNTSGTFDLVYIVTGANGCTDTTTITVSNILNPSIGSANPGGTTGCAPLNICFPLNNYATNPTSTIYYVDFGDASPIQIYNHPPPTQVCHTYTTSSCGEIGDQYVFEIKAVNACDSSSAVVSPIRVYTGPQPNFVPSAITACINTPITMVNNTTTGFGGNCTSTTVYQWNFGDGQTLTTLVQTSPIHTYTTPGTYTVTLTVTNSCGPAVQSVDICIESPLTAVVSSSNATGCAPFIVTANDLTDYSQSCDTIRNWQVLFNGSVCAPNTAGYNFVGGTSATSVSPQIEFTNPGNYTIQLTVSNECGISNATIPVVIRKTPEVAINPIPQVCENTAFSPVATALSCTSPISGYAWSFPGASPATANTLNPGQITYATGGTYNLQLTVTNACGATIVPATITVNPNPLPVNPAVNTPICSGSTANFSSDFTPGLSYNWTGPNSYTNANGNFNLTNTTVSQSGMYYVFGILNGCPSPLDSVELIVNPTPVANAGPNQNFCANNAPFQLTGTPVGGTWTGTGVSPTGLFSPVTAGVGTHILSYSYTVPGTGCTDSTNKTVIVVPLPVVNAGVDTVLCNAPIPVQLIGTPAGGTWIGPNVSPTGLFTPNGVGNFTLTYEVVNANNCLGSDTRLITVTNGITPVAGNDTAVCINSANLQLVGSPAGGVWSGSFINPTGLFTPTTAGVFPLVYSYGAGNCLNQDTLLMTVNSLPIVNAGANQALCINANPTNLVGAPVGGTWSGTGITNPTGTFSAAVAGLGTHTLTYSYTNPTTGCTNTATKNITVNALPVVNAGLDLTLCDQPIGQPLVGLPAGGGWTGTNIVANTFTPNGLGTFTAIYFYANANGCINSDSILINVINPTAVNAGLDTAVCVGSAMVNLTGLPAGGTWTGAGVGGSGTFNPTTAGIFPAIYNLGTGTCLTTDTLLITVNALPVVNAGANDDICIDAPPLNLTGSPLNGIWSGTGITNATGIFDPAISGLGTFTLNYSYTDLATGCSSSSTKDITVHALPTVNAGVDTVLCNQPIGAPLFGTPAGGTWTGPNISPTGIFTPSGLGLFTVTYSYTDGFGCVNTDTRDVTVSNPVSSVAGNDTAVCVNGPSFGLTGSPVGGFWSGPFINPTGIFNPSTAGIYSVVYAYGSGNCQTTDTVIVTVNALPLVNAGLDADICISSSSQNLTATPVGGTWSGIGITDVNLGTFDPVALNAGAYSIYYSYTEVTTGCSQIDSLLVNVQPLPVPSFTYPLIGCVNTPVAFTNITPGTTNSTWTFGDGGTSIVNNPNHAYTATGNYSVQLISTSAFGCVDSITQAIDIYDIPTADFALSTDSACSPVTVNFTDLSIGQGISYAWDFGNGQSSTLANPAGQIYFQGQFLDSTYFIQLTVTNVCGTHSLSDSVIAMPLPQASFGIPSNTGCSPLILNFINNSTGIPDNYQWDFGDGSSSTTNAVTFTHLYTTGLNDTIYNISLIATNECGSDTATNFVHVFPNSVNAFFNASTLSGCGPLSVDFTQFSVGGTNFDWDFGDGNLSNVTNPTHVYQNPGTYVVTLIVTDGCGVDTATATITVFPQPTISFNSSSLSVCVNEVINFTNTSAGISSTFWDFGDGFFSVLANPSHSYASAGNYYVTLTGTATGNGCPSSDSILVNVKLTPTAAFNPNPAQGCINLEVQFTNTSTNANYYAWDFGNSNVSASQSPVHTYNVAGTYNVKLTVANNNGCADSVIHPVIAYPLPVANFSFVTSDPCEAPGAATFTNTSTGANNYQWNLGNGLSSTLTNPVANYGAVGTYTISLIATSTFGCSDTTTQQLGFYNYAQADFTLSNDSLCEGDSVLLSSFASGYTSLSWNIGNGNFSNATQTYVSFANSGNYVISLIAYGNGGCNDTAVLNTTITVLPLPVADFTWENIQLPDPSSGLVVFTNTSFQASNYLWEFGTGGSSTATNPSYEYMHFGEYQATLYAFSSFGCMDSTFKIVTVDFPHGLYIPSAIHPENADYNLSHFIPKGVGLKEYEILIYDDWGNLIWSSTALDEDGRPTEAWDGRYLGEIVQQDAYVWKARAVFYGGEVWEGNNIGQGKPKRSGTITVLH